MPVIGGWRKGNLAQSECCRTLDSWNPNTSTTKNRYGKFKCTHDFGTFIHVYGYLEGLLAPLLRQKLKQLPWLLALSARLCRSSTLPPFSLSTGLALALPNATGHTLHVLLSDRQAVIIRMLGDLGFLYEL